MRKPTKFIIGICVIIFLIYFYFIGLNFKNYLLIFNPQKITPLSPIYYFIFIREQIQSKFIFGDEDTAYWLLILAEKRLNETEILKSAQINSLAKKQLRIATTYQLKAEKIYKTLIDKIDTNYLHDKINNNQNNIYQLNLLLKK